MNRASRLLTLVFPCLLLASPLRSPASEQSSARDRLEKALQASNVMPKGYKISAVEGEHEVDLQTRLNPDTEDLDKSCKIDAVLLAKQVFQKRPETAKVRVRFFEPDGSHYRQLTVTAGDVTAYGSGGINVDRLLASLDVLRGTYTPPPTNVTGPPRGWSTFQNGALQFYYPQNWKVTPAGNEQQGYIASINIPCNTWANVLVRAQRSANSPEQQAYFDTSYFMNQGFHLVRKGPTTVGFKRLPAYELLIGQGRSIHNCRFEQHVYFGAANEIYSLTLQCDSSEAQKLSPDLLRVFSTVSVH